MEYVGIDLGKSQSQVCTLTEDGELQQRRIRTSRERLVAVFSERPPSRILIEASTGSEWVARLLETLGHEVIVADPSETEPAAKAPPIPERKPEPPVIQPELEAFAQRFSVQGPTAPLQAPVQSDAPAETASVAPLRAPVETASVAPARAPVETARVAPPQAPVQSVAPADSARPAPAQAPAQGDAPAQTASAVAVQGNAKAAAQPSATVMSFASRPGGVGNASGNESGAISRLNYADRVLLWLKRHGTYPREGLRFKMEGVVLLRFAIRRDGTILYYDLIKESSWDTLNGAVRRMMDRSSPVPRIPRDIAKDEIVFTIPVHFTVH